MNIKFKACTWHTNINIIIIFVCMLSGRSIRLKFLYSFNKNGFLLLLFQCEKEENISLTDDNVRNFSFIFFTLKPVLLVNLYSSDPFLKIV